MDRTKSNSAKHFNLSRFLPAVSVFALTSACACFTCAAQPVGLYASTATRGDHVSDQWAFPTIHLNDAWDITTGSDEVKVGIIDSGVDGNHEDLYANIDTSLSCCFSPYFNTGLQDSFWHGTFVAGVVGADGSNNYGVSGTCWDVDLVSLRVGAYGEAAPVIAKIPDAIDYASQNGIPIVNISIGILDEDGDNTQVISDIDDAIHDYPGLVVCAAGNFGSNMEEAGNQVYPACSLWPNVLSVGNSDSADDIAASSNYGRFSVDLFAPGEDIWSTKPGDTYDYHTGTSFSAPLVAGVAALLKSASPSLTTSQLKSAIVNNVDEIPGMYNKCVSGGRLNALKALRAVVPEIVPASPAMESTIGAGSYRTYRMDCGNGRYTIVFDGLGDSRVDLYVQHSAGPLLSSTFYGSSTHSLQFLCTSPKTVYLRVYNDESSDCDAEISASNHLHSYSSFYSMHNALYHKAYCECRAYVLEPHLFPSDGQSLGRCVVCGALPPLALGPEPTEGGLAPDAPAVAGYDEAALFALGRFNGGIYPISEEA